jgi:hypothetical protein
MIARILARFTRTDRTDAPGLPYGVYKHRAHAGNLTGSTARTDRPTRQAPTDRAPGLPYGVYKHRAHAGNLTGSTDRSR